MFTYISKHLFAVGNSGWLPLYALSRSKKGFSSLTIEITHAVVKHVLLFNLFPSSQYIDHLPV